MVADGFDNASLEPVRQALLAKGAMPRYVAPRIGSVLSSDGQEIIADASFENAPGFLFDAMVAADGGAAAATLVQDGQAIEFLKDQYRHCKPILIIGDAQTLLDKAGIPQSLPSGDVDEGLLLTTAALAQDAALQFLEAIAKHRFPARETDPPLV